MNNITRRLNKAEKALRIDQKPYPVNIAGLEMTSDELDKLLKEIWAEPKGLQIKEYQALCAGDTEK